MELRKLGGEAEEAGEEWDWKLAMMPGGATGRETRRKCDMRRCRGTETQSASWSLVAVVNTVEGIFEE